MEKLKEKIAKFGYLKENVALSGMTTLKVGGIARYVIEVYSAKDLVDLLFVLKKEKVPYFILGNGSNLLASDEEYSGVIISLKKYLGKIEVNGEQMKAEAGAGLAALGFEALNASLTGLEWSVLIPASIGGAIMSNAGANGECISNNLISIEVILDNKIKIMQKADIDFGYRYCSLKEKGAIILSATFQLAKGEEHDIEEKMLAFRKKRLTTQPWDLPSAGSVFKNPPEHKAYQLIIDSGLSGSNFGDAQLSTKHHNFIVNAGKAEAADVKRLIEHIKKMVYNEFGILLMEEIEYFN